MSHLIRQYNRRINREPFRDFPTHGLDVGLIPTVEQFVLEVHFKVYFLTFEHVLVFIDGEVLDFFLKLRLLVDGGFLGSGHKGLAFGFYCKGLGGGWVVKGWQFGVCAGHCLGD